MGKKTVIVHIDGPSGAGKSTLGESLALSGCTVFDVDDIDGECFQEVFSEWDQKKWKGPINKSFYRHVNECFSKSIKEFINEGHDVIVFVGSSDLRSITNVKHKYALNVPISPEIYLRSLKRDYENFVGLEGIFQDLTDKDPRNIMDFINHGYKVNTKFLYYDQWRKYMKDYYTNLKRKGFKLKTYDEIQKIVENLCFDKENKKCNS